MDSIAKGSSGGTGLGADIHASHPKTPPGRVASLHVHPPSAGEPMLSVERMTLVAGQGIEQDARFFARRSRSGGEVSRRQVSFIEREQIAEHAAALGLESIPPGAVRANVETEGLDLGAFLGKELVIGEAVLLIYEARQPCSKMDAICPGLRALMQNGRQGVLAQVTRSGQIELGDAIALKAP